MRAIFRPGFQMAKAGVHLLELQDASLEQAELALDDGVQDRGQLMHALDDLNQWYGSGTVAMASAGVAGARRNWVMKQERKTLDYKSCWKSMPTAVAGSPTAPSYV